jgi:hydrogenase expression/formation protein HypD
MEVCGTHTQIISKIGIKSVLSPQIKLLSGPGCPVCVTDEEYIDTAIEILHKYDVAIASFGDLLRVRGTYSSLVDEKSNGKDVRVIYSPLDLIKMAEGENKEIIFLGVGFETTAPVIALAIKTSYEKKLYNLSFLTSIKLMRPILRFILEKPEKQIDGLICPGHVASVKGSEYFNFITDEFNIPAVISGFEEMDILRSIHFLVKQININKNTSLANLYTRCVKPMGNPIANQLMEEVFEVSDGNWRAIGYIKDSFLSINKKYEKFDAAKKYKVNINNSNSATKCSCGEILLGVKTPFECLFFDSRCSPQNPKGPCMVSSEGTCAIAYKYRKEEEWKEI